MQSKINNDNNTPELKLKGMGVEELLMNNKEILNTLVLENTQKKDKSFISIKELEIIKDYESNLLQILENCPPQILKSLLEETSSYKELTSKEQDLKEETDEEK